MTTIVYLYSKCSTCQKAVKFLEQHKVVFKSVEIKTTAPSVDELKKMLKYQGGDIKKLFNTSGMLYRELNLTQKLPAMSSEQALELLSQNGMLVKRPFLLGKDLGLVGFREPQWQQALLA